MILEKIIADNLPDLEKRKQAVPLAKLKESIRSLPAPLDFAAALRGPDLQLIAEVKKASPSRGVIRDDFDPAQIATIYLANGASAISVLTEERYFQGKLEYLSLVKESTGRKIPVLRKDFIHDSYQVYESRAAGADALLLIVAILSPDRLKELLRLSHKLGMHCLVEVHNELELETACRSEARIIGINNRDLRTFTVDLSVTEKIRSLLGAEKVVVSESGIHRREDIRQLEKIGVNAVLIGEAFMAAKDIGAKMREIMG